MLTAEQKRFFETFGYLVMPGLVKDDIDWITEEFEMVFQDRGVVHDGTKRSTVVPFIDQRERLCTLLDHPKIEGLIGSLLGDDFNYVGGDGNFYAGDTDGTSAGGSYLFFIEAYGASALHSKNDLSAFSSDPGCE